MNKVKKKFSDIAKRANYRNDQKFKKEAVEKVLKHLEEEFRCCSKSVMHCACLSNSIQAMRDELLTFSVK